MGTRVVVVDFVVVVVGVVVLVPVVVVAAAITMYDRALLLQARVHGCDGPTWARDAPKCRAIEEWPCLRDDSGRAGGRPTLGRVAS